MPNRLIGLRAGYGDTQSKLARYLGLSTQGYYRKEKGYQDFTQTEIKKIIEKYNLKPEEVMDIFFM